MFLHIGNNIIIEDKTIIAIYNLETIERTKEFVRIVEKLKKTNYYLMDNKSEAKSFILTQEKGVEKGYLSNISTNTLEKRAQMSIKKRG